MQRTSILEKKIRSYASTDFYIVLRGEEYTYLNANDTPPSNVVANDSTEDKDGIDANDIEDGKDVTQKHLK